MRDKGWLVERAEYLWKRYFEDVRLKNDIVVRFGRPAYTRLGSIKFSRRKGQKTTVVTITGLFKDPNIPSFVVDATLGHELVHYAHGFYSPHVRLFRYPHAGGIVKKEMGARGMGEIYELQRKWLRKNWRNYVSRRVHLL